MAVINLEDLKIALETLANHNLSRIPADETLVATQQFSAGFEGKMQALILQAGQRDTDEAGRRTPPVHLRLHSRKRLLAAAIILAILISLFSITAAREAVFSFFVQVYEKFSTVIFNRDPAGTTQSTTPPAGADTIDTLLPTFIPDGYQLSDQLVTDVFSHVVFTNASGNTIMISKQRLNHTQFIIDTENVQAVEINVNGYNGVYYISKGVTTVVWHNESYAFMITGILDKDTLIYMAESTMKN